MCPKEAQRKIKSAYVMGNAVYLYGVTGIGKTTFIKKFLGRKKYLYCSAEEMVPELIYTEIEKMKKSSMKTEIVVIDDLYYISDVDMKEQYAALIQHLLSQKQVWLVLVSRAPVPGWLLPIHVKYGFLLIQEEDFCFSRSGQDTYLEKCGVYLNKEEADIAWKMGRGHPVSLRLMAMEKGNLEQTMKKMWILLENHVYDKWEPQLREFLMETSIVECYTKELAGMITGRGDVENLIARAEEVGNFMTRTGQDGIWEYRWAMRKSLRRQLFQKYGKEKIGKLYSHAGLYYEMKGNYKETLEMYGICKDEESISRVLTANAKRNPAVGQYFELRKYYLSFPEKTVKNNPSLTSYMSMLQSILMNEEESERWYGYLKEYIASHTGSEQREAKGWLWYLDIALPHRGSVGLISIFKSAGNLLTGKNLMVPDFSVTTNLPSLMNGGKDFCEWSKIDRELAASIGKIVQTFLGKYGKGIVSLGLAESGLEKGIDNFEVMRLTEKGRMENGADGKIEILFVVSGLLSWLAILNGNAEYAQESLLTIRKQAEAEAPQMLPNIDAFLCRVSLYQGRLEDVERWMKMTPGELEEFCTLHRFQYLTRVRVYLQTGKYEQAYALLQQILYYAKKMKRTYIKMEATLLLAIIMYRTGQDVWRGKMQECISQAEEYHFVRLFSREGKAVLELLTDDSFIWKDMEYKQQILQECRKMAEFYPGYLAQGADWEVKLSGNGLRILRLQAEGYSIREIADYLNIKESTVKYHSGETYRKLGVRSRSEAVKEAQKRKLI